MQAMVVGYLRSINLRGESVAGVAALLHVNTAKWLKFLVDVGRRR